MLNLADIPGSDLALLRVIASDGVNTAGDDSDATFQVMSQVRMISPLFIKVTKKVFIQ